MKTPKAQYSWKCSPETAKWITAVTALVIARARMASCLRVLLVASSMPDSLVQLVSDGWSRAYNANHGCQFRAA
jgi:hypothetical protein